MNLFTKVSFFTLIAMLTFTACFLSACSSSGGFTPPTTPNSTQETPSVQPSYGGDDYVEVVYFHRTRRCYSCQWAGDAVEYTVQTYFANELASGRLILKMLDVQDETNADIANEYGAYGSSLYINDVVDGIDHIEPMPEIWYHVGDAEEFVELVRAEIEQHLGGI